MIIPPYPIAPRLGPLAAPGEEELVAAYPELREHALTLPWAAEALGLQSHRLVALARAGDLVVIPGPWPMRQAHASDLGYLVPAWQLTAGRHVHPAVPALIAAAAETGRTSLELHRFMTTPLERDGSTPAALLHDGHAAQGAALLRGRPFTPAVPPPTKRRRRSIAFHAPHRAGSRRPLSGPPVRPALSATAPPQPAGGRGQRVR